MMLICDCRRELFNYVSKDYIIANFPLLKKMIVDGKIVDSS
jgi:hypothetical protein